jgi:hypothetical protein
LSISLGAEGAGGRENKNGDFHNQVKGFKLSSAIKPPFHAPDFCVNIQLDASAPPFGHGIGGCWLTYDTLFLALCAILTPNTKLGDGPPSHID